MGADAAGCDAAGGHALRDLLADLLSIPTKDRGEALQATLHQPGLIWAYTRTAGTGMLIEQIDGLPDGDFRWLHLNLSDQRSLRWIEQQEAIPPGIAALMISRDAAMAPLTAESGAIGFVIRDFERELDPARLGRIATLHVALMPGLVVTGRSHPLHSADMLKQRLSQADIADHAGALDLLLDTICDHIAALTLDLMTGLLEAEEDLLTDDIAPDTRELVSARRRSAQLHRMIGGLRATLQRMEHEPEMPGPLRLVPLRLHPRLVTLDGDIVATQSQLRLLRDELDLQAAQRTNRNLYFISVMTALMMPATLVTGFFGMNTGELPLATGHGTLIATVIAIASAAGTYFAFRMLGLVRRR